VYNEWGSIIANCIVTKTFLVPPARLFTERNFALKHLVGLWATQSFLRGRQVPVYAVVERVGKVPFSSLVLLIFASYCCCYLTYSTRVSFEAWVVVLALPF
jgi:hypothetical protein